MTTLGTVTYINARPDIRHLTNEDEVSFIPMAAVSEVNGYFDGSQSRQLGAVKKGYTPFKNGDLIFAKITPCMENGKSAIVHGLLNGVGYGSTEFHVLSPTSAISTKYAFLMVTSQDFRRIAEHNMRGAAGQKRVPPDFLNGYAFPLPPLAEQVRIVQKVEELFSKLDAGVAELRRTQGLLKRYRQSLLHAAVTGELSRDWRAQNPVTETGHALLQRLLAERRDRWVESGKKGKYKEPAAPKTDGLPTLPKEWVWASVEQVITELRNGISDKPDAETGLAILRISAVRPLKVDIDDVRYLKEETIERYSDSLLHVGDILFTRYNGNPKFVGVCGIVSKIDGRLVYPDKLMRARPYSDLVGGQFIQIACSGGTSRAFIADRVKTSAGQAGIAGSDVKATPLPIPPLPEQEFIVSEVERRLSVLDNLEATVTAELKRAESTRQSILHRAFTGKLVPQNSSDEPASALLDGIQAERLAAGAAAIRAGTGRRGPGRPRTAPDSEPLLTAKE